MRIHEFFLNVFYENIILYIVCLLLATIATIPLFKKYTNGILDPFFFILFMTVFAYAIPPFLFFTGNCSFRNFAYFLISETFLWIGFYIVYKLKRDFSINKIKNEEVIMEYLFYISLLLFILSKLYSYLFIGIPLFMQYRLDAYIESNGLGILKRISEFASLFLLIYSFYLKDHNKRVYLFVFILIFIDTILSGSKSAVLTIFHSYFIYTFFYKDSVPKIKTKYILIMLCFPFLILLLANSGSDISAVSAGIFTRMIANGDVFWYAYPNNTIDNIHINNFFTNLFVGLLGPFRLIDYNTVEPNIGLQINWEIEPTIYGTNAGPNARPSIAGWIYFKWYGLIFSFLIGCFISFCIYYIKKYFTKSILGVILFGFLYQNAITFLIDPLLGFSYLSNFILNIIIYTLIIITILKIKEILDTRSNQ